MAPRTSSNNSRLTRYQNQQKRKKDKAKSKSSKNKSKKNHHSDVPQEEYDENERILRQFDMNMAYGPCVGMNRLKRWERAKSLGLNPPQDVLDLLKSSLVQQESLFQKYNI